MRRSPGKRATDGYLLSRRNVRGHSLRGDVCSIHGQRTLAARYGSNGRVARPFVRTALLAVSVAVVSACDDSASQSASNELEALAKNWSGIVVIANPANCSLGTEQARALNAAAAALGGRGVLLATMPLDSAELRRAVDLLGLSFEIRASPRGGRRFVSGVVGEPAVAVLRAGRVEVVAQGLMFKHVDRWLPEALGVDFDAHASVGAMAWRPVE